MTSWYELRVAGSPGTANGGDAKVGIAIGLSGRLCAVSSGQAMRFESEELAFDYLVRQTTPGRYRFEAVRCDTTDAVAVAPTAPASL